jgi:exonuclease SbcC
LKIKKLKIKDYVGIEELDWDPGQTNLIEGPKGSGKSSITEAIEKAFSNNDRRTEVVRHGSGISTLFIETDDGLKIKRKFKADDNNYKYLRLEGDMVSKSTEGQLRKFLSGDIFRPLDFIDEDVDTQTEIILSMIKMNYSDEEICNWFGEDVLSDINTSKHLLQILKDIEKKYYDERTEVKREIRTLKAQVKGIEAELPKNYDGEKWKDKNVQEYYDKVSKARDLKEKLEKARNLKENFEDRVKAIEAEGENDKTRIKEKYQNKKEDVKELINLQEDKIKGAKDNIQKLDVKLNTELKNIDNWMEKEIQKIKAKADRKKEVAKETIANIKYAKENEIQSYKEKIASKKSQLNSLGDQKKIEINSIEKEVQQKIKNEKENLSHAGALLEEKESIEEVKKRIDKHQEAADEVAEMREHLHEWNRMVDIRDGKLAKKKDCSDHLTNLIEIAREKPAELLKQHELPLEGISVDEESRIRINDTLLDGLSDGEKLEVAFKLALQRMGKLRIMCLDGFERLNESEQEKVLRMCEEHDIQTFVTRVEEQPEDGFEIVDEDRQAEICEECKYKDMQQHENGEDFCCWYEQMLVGCKKFESKPKQEESDND